MNALLPLLMAVVWLAESKVGSADADVVVRGHVDHLARFGTGHIKCRAEFLEQPIREQEVWFVPKRSRVIEQNIPEAGMQLRDYKGDFTEIKTVAYGDGVKRAEGWDPRIPLSEQPKIADVRNRFSEIICFMGGSIRDPEKRDHFWFSCGIDPIPGLSIDVVSRRCQIAFLNHEGPLHTVRTIPSPDIPTEMKITFDSEHGYLIRKVEHPEGVQCDVQEFHNLGGGLFFPKRVERRRNGELVTTTTVTLVESNIPIADHLLQLEFPEGASVTDLTTGAIHLWGKGAPVESAAGDDVEAFVDKHSLVHHEPISPVNRGYGSLLIWVNLIAFLLIFVLYAVRSRLARGVK